METPNKPFLTLPAAIILAATIIAVAFIYVKKPSPTTSNTDNQVQQEINLSPITSSDHILGNPNAPIKIVEYSDPSCPYCKVFNPTMLNLMNDYGPSGKVAWVYRSFPLDKPDGNGNILHPNAGYESQALECAGAYGNDKYWSFQKGLYETASSTNTQDRIADQKRLTDLAKSIGVDLVSWNDCLSSGKYKDRVNSEYLSGENAGVSGTPTSFIVLDSNISYVATNYIGNALIQYQVPSNFLHITSDNKIILMTGAMPEAMISGLIDTLLKN